MRFLEQDRQVVAPYPRAAGIYGPHSIAGRPLRGAGRRWCPENCRCGGTATSPGIRGPPPPPATPTAIFKKGPYTIGQEALPGEVAEVSQKLSPRLDGHRGIDRATGGDAHKAGNVGANACDS